MIYRGSSLRQVCTWNFDGFKNEDLLITFEKHCMQFSKKNHNAKPYENVYYNCYFCRMNLSDFLIISILVSLQRYVVCLSYRPTLATVPDFKQNTMNVNDINHCQNFFKKIDNLPKWDRHHVINFLKKICINLSNFQTSVQYFLYVMRHMTHHEIDSVTKRETKVTKPPQ